jgi:hypothetical protein
MAWAVLALVRASERLGDTAYLAAAQRLGQWIFDTTSDERGGGGYTGGIAEGGGQLHWKATEHNADVYAAFMNLHRATGDPVWRERALSARHFLTTMWNEQDGFFWTGTAEDGTTPNRRPVPEDAQSWTLLALGELERYRPALDWADSTLRYKTCPGYETASGYRFSACRRTSAELAWRSYERVRPGRRGDSSRQRGSGCQRVWLELPDADASSRGHRLVSICRTGAQPLLGPRCY